MLKRNPTTPKPSKGIVRSLTLGITALSALFAVSSAAFSLPRAEARAEEVSVDLGEEKTVDREELLVNINSSSLTDTAQSFTVLLRSKKTVGYPNDTRNKHVYVTPLDASFDLAKAREEATAAKAEAEGRGEEYIPLEYEAAVCNVSYTKTSTIVIPEFVEYGSLFRFKVTTIQSNVCLDTKTESYNYDGIERLIIPSSITAIEEEALPDIPETMTIFCEAPEFIPDADGNPTETKTYPTPWTNVDVVYDYELTEDERDELSNPTTSPKNFGVGADFFLGYQTERFFYPMYMEYRLEEKQADGSYLPLDGEHFFQCEIVSEVNDYDGVGSTMGNTDVTQFISIPMEKNQRVISDSIVFHNIYRVTDDPENPGQVIPDVTAGAHKAVPAILYKVIPHFEDFYEVKPASVTRLGSYIQFEIEMLFQGHENGIGMYQYLNESTYKNNEENIKNGTFQVRYQFTALDQAQYHFVYKDGNTLEHVYRRISTPISYVLIPGNAYRFGMLINLDDVPLVTHDNLVAFGINEFTIKGDLYKPATHSIVTKSSFSVSFGDLILFDDVPGFGATNAILVFTLVYVGYVVLFAAGAVGYYFYAKRRYRNDEFRRVNTKRFVLNAVKNFVGFLFVLSAVLFIISRWGMLRSSVVVFNPLDAFVIVASVIALIFIGFTIKNLVVSFKNARKRKEAAKLKLDQDVADDGTN